MRLSTYKQLEIPSKSTDHCLWTQLKWEGGAGSIEINGTEYVLQQCRWHLPSEHTINGKRYLIL
jgi:carbonic anhydrase